MSLSCSAKETHFLSDWLSGRRNARVNYLLIILPKMISFALLLAIGFVCAWRGVLKDEGRSTLSGLLLSLVLPCLIVTLMHERGTTFAKLWNYRRFVLCQCLKSADVIVINTVTEERIEFPFSAVEYGNVRYINDDCFAIKHGKDEELCWIVWEYDI